MRASSTFLGRLARKRSPDPSGVAPGGEPIRNVPPPCGNMHSLLFLVLPLGTGPLVCGFFRDRGRTPPRPLHTPSPGNRSPSSSAPPGLGARMHGRGWANAGTRQRRGRADRSRGARSGGKGEQPRDNARWIRWRAGRARRITGNNWRGTRSGKEVAVSAWRLLAVQCGRCSRALRPLVASGRSGRRSTTTSLPSPIGARGTLPSLQLRSGGSPCGGLETDEQCLPAARFLGDHRLSHSSTPKAVATRRWAWCDPWRSGSLSEKKSLPADIFAALTPSP